MNYAQKWMPGLLSLVVSRTLTNMFMVSAKDVGFLNAKTFHLTSIALSGYKEHSRSGGWNRGKVTNSDTTFTLKHDRDIEFFIDRLDIDETNQALSIQNIAARFTVTQQAPEVDALFFQRVCENAAKGDGLLTETAPDTITPDNVLQYLKGLTRRGNISLYRPHGTYYIYVTPEIMDALELCKAFTRVIDVTKVGGSLVDTRITSWNGYKLVEVEDLSRFYSKFDFAEGYKPASDGKKINAVVASPYTVKTVAKIESIFYFVPGNHTNGDGYLYQDRRHWDTIVLPNGDAEIDSIAVDLQPSSGGLPSAYEPKQTSAPAQTPKTPGIPGMTIK